MEKEGGMGGQVEGRQKEGGRVQRREREKESNREIEDKGDNLIQLM